LSRFAFRKTPNTYKIEQAILLSALSPLMARAGKKLAMLVLSHLLSSLFDDAAQSITPF
jgi:hypothetical protein